jgi:hypothetical protein
VVGLAALTFLPDGGANESGKRKRRFSLRRKKAKWAEGSASATDYDGRDEPAAVVPDFRRMAVQGLIVRRVVLGDLASGGGR